MGAPENIQGLADTLRKLVDRSQSVNRVAHHLLRLDVHDTWTWALANPLSVTKELSHG